MRLHGDRTGVRGGEVRGGELSETAHECVAGKGAGQRARGKCLKERAPCTLSHKKEKRDVSGRSSNVYHLVCRPNLTSGPPAPPFPAPRGPPWARRTAGLFIKVGSNARCVPGGGNRAMDPTAMNAIGRSAAPSATSATRATRRAMNSGRYRSAVNEVAPADSGNFTGTGTCPLDRTRSARDYRSLEPLRSRKRAAQADQGPSHGKRVFLWPHNMPFQ